VFLKETVWAYKNHICTRILVSEEKRKLLLIKFHNIDPLMGEEPGIQMKIKT
jgi:hypothetical protein